MRLGLVLVAAAAAVFLCLGQGAALAQAGGGGGDDPKFLAFSAGYHDLFDDSDAFEGRLEYRHDRKFWIFKPMAGVLATTDAAVYGYAGVMVDIYFGRRVVLTPSFAPGLYRKGDGKDLGGALEFKSQLELAYRFDNRARLGVGISHLSNASIYDRNPGTETVFVTYAMPLRW